MALRRPPLAWLSSLDFVGPALVVALGLTACDADKCKHVCTESSDESRETSDSETTTSSADAALSSALSSNEVTSDGSQLTEAGSTQSEVFSCRTDRDCVATPFPACSPQLNQCVACTLDKHCTTDNTHCSVAASDELNRCIECEADSECTSGSCEQGSCLVCNPQTNQGCNGGVCVTDAETSAHCVECAVDEDCLTGLCIANQCLTCDLDSNRGCNDGLYCLSRLDLQLPSYEDAGSPDAASDPTWAEGVCVECAESKPCVAPERPVCLNHACIACDPTAPTNNGCRPSAPFCQEGTFEEALETGSPASSDSTSPDTVSSDDTSVGNTSLDTPRESNRCVECRDTSDCENAHCVDNVCHPCDPIGNAGCADDEICQPRQVADDVTKVTYVCLECSEEKACAEEQHCGPDGRCHECLDSSHCNTANPICQPDLTCWKCSTDEQCPSPDSPRCSPLGLCVGCLEDEHCANAVAGPACVSEFHRCAECTATNITACNGNPCNVISSKCYGADDAIPDAGVSAECKRCTQTEDCDQSTECVDLGEKGLRCVPLAEGSEDRTDCSVQEFPDLDGETRPYCIPQDC